MKIIKPTIFGRLRQGAKFGASAGASAATAVGLLSTLSGLSGPPIVGIASGAFVLASLVGAYWKGKLSYIPQMAVDEFDQDVACTYEFADSVSLREACEMTKPYYGDEYVDYSIAEKWMRSNPEAFVVVRNAKGELCSCFGIISMKTSCFDEFIRGRIKDSEFTDDDILNTETTKKAERLYLSGVIVSDPRSFLGSKRVTMMTWCILMHYKKVFKLKKNREIYALAVSKEGEQLLKTMAFTLCSPAAERRDHCNLYMLKFDKTKWQDAVKKVPDWSLCCTQKEVVYTP